MASEPASGLGGAVLATPAVVAAGGPKRRRKGPAKPILEGGRARPALLRRQEPRLLDAPVDRLGRLFLPAHAVGFANSMGRMFVVHTLLLTATGYSLTLLMASLFRRLIQMRAIWTVIISLARS